MNKLKIGMISFAHLHAVSYLRALAMHPCAEVTAIADPDKERVRSYCEEYNIRWFADDAELLQTDVDAVIICTENALHSQATVKSAAAGKHVLCEKPLAISYAQLNEMIDACKRHGVQLMTSFPNRYIPMVCKARQDIRDGAIGQLIGVKATNKGAMPGGWFVQPELSGGGSLMDHSTHVADLMNWIIEARPVKVYATASRRLHDIPVEDTAVMKIWYENGVFVTLDASWSRMEYLPYDRDLTLTFVGTEGTIDIDYFAQSHRLYTKSSGRGQLSYFGDNKDELLIDDFIRCIRSGDPVPISGEDGWKSTVVALKAFESLEKGSAVNISREEFER